MHFLCLHGMGTNSKVFEMQTAAIRYSLGPEHTYEFIDGAYPAAKAPGLDAITSDDVETLQYSLDPDVDDSLSARKALLDLKNLVTSEGPFDGIMAFSQGAGLAASFIVHAQRTTRAVPFRCAIFFSGGVPMSTNAAMLEDVGERQGSNARLLCPEQDGELIEIPTAHIWGANDTLYPTFGPVLGQLCAQGNRSEYVHDGGHEIPGARDPAGVQKAVLMIKRAIAQAESAAG